MFQPYKVHMIHGGEQRLYRFPNGYGASVVQHNNSYGGRQGFWELAVIEFEDENNDSWEITYDTPVTSDVEGWLPWSEGPWSEGKRSVEGLLVQAEGLPRKEKNK